MHALCHFHASALLNAGESIKALADYLGHADPRIPSRSRECVTHPVRVWGSHRGRGTENPVFLSPSTQRPSPSARGADPAPKPSRRAFSPAYKLAMVAAYESAPNGEKGALLRREGLYSSHIIEWTRARDSSLPARQKGRQTNTGAAAAARPSKNSSQLTCWRTSGGTRKNRRNT